MVSAFICGTFHPEYNDQDELGVIGSGATSPDSTPRRSSARKNAFCKDHNSNHNKNPYSTRGRDKFDALLADLEEKKKKIYTQTDPGNILFVQFAYTSSNDCVPIVVRLKDKNGQPRSPPREEENSKDKQVTNNSENPHQSTVSKQIYEKKGSSRRSLSWSQWRKPSYYMPVAIILILIFLVFFGRSVAILCTSIGWYMVPTLKAGSSGSERTTNRSEKKKKKELTRRSSENKIAVTARSPDRSPTQHGHRRSW